MLEDLEITALEPEVLIKSYTAYSDTTSRDFGIANMCGLFTYFLVEPVLEFAAVLESEDGSEFQILINTSDYDEARLYSVYLAVQL